MKKARKCAIFLWIVIAALVLGLSVPVSLDQLHPAEVHVQAADDTDGVYTIEGRLWHATMNQPSMGNSAVTQPMKIVKSGDKTMLQMEFHSLSSGVFSGYLYSLHYFPSWNRENEVPQGAEAVSVTVTEYYNDIYDDYNRPSNGLDEAIRGRFYPHYAVMPVEWNADSTWVQVYVPVMEAISAGSGRQYARLQLDWNTLKKTEEKVEDISLSPAEPSSGNVAVPVATTAPDKTTTASNKGSSTGKKKLKIGSLQDGTYTITGEMVKSDQKTKSMANEAINHNIILTVKKGKYSLTMSLSGLTVGNAKGYLSKLKYFKTGYKKDKNGVPLGKKAGVTIKSYQKDKTGKRVSDSYGTNYPAKITFTMISEAKKDGYVPLQVFVPIMEAISAGTGTQPVYLKLDLSSITAGKKSAKSKSSKKTSSKNSASKSSGSSNSSGNSAAGNSSSSGTGTSDTGNAVTGTVYSCQVIPSYQHPVTGSVEDSGGSSSYATGQGMVESVMGTSGMLEKTESGDCYLTVRMGLMDLTSGHTFWVQKRGESGWKSVSAVVTQSGSDQNGKTSDFCFSVPDQDSIVKVSMYVEPMGRNVVFYASLDNLKKGQPTDMRATKVTADTTAASSAAEETVENNGDGADALAASENTEDISALSDAGLSSAQGLSLSTAGEAASSDGSDSDGAEQDADGTGSGEMSMAKWILVLTCSMTISGFLFLAAGAGLVYYFRRNWHRWGEEMIDDEDVSYR